MSSDRCLAVLMGLSQELEDGIAKGIYSVPGGYQRFLEKQCEIEKKYRLVPGKGIQVGQPAICVSKLSGMPKESMCWCQLGHIPPLGIHGNCSTTR